MLRSSMRPLPLRAASQLPIVPVYDLEHTHTLTRILVSL